VRIDKKEEDTQQQRMKLPGMDYTEKINKQENKSNEISQQ